MKKLIAIAAVGAAFTGFAGTANAALVITSINSVYSSPYKATIEVGSSQFNNVSLSPQTLTGQLNGANVALLAYCVDVFQTAKTGTFDVVTLQDYLSDLGKASRFDALAALIDSHGAATTKLSNSAVQLAVWEIMYEQPKWGSLTFDVSSGNFDSENWSSSSIKTTANGYLGALGGVTIDPNLTLYVAKSSTKQDFLFFTYNTPAVPEPATWAMMIAGFGLVGASLRKRATRPTVSFG